MGATPEVLLKSERQKLETVSLAGTQSRRTDKDYSWHTKEIEEQAFVSRYLLDVFISSTFIHIPPRDLKHWKAEGSSSEYQLPLLLQKNWHQIWVTLFLSCTRHLLYAAILNRKQQITFPTIEKHDRRYYTGYLGPGG
jgi:isochorismate synthase